MTRNDVFFTRQRDPAWILDCYFINSFSHFLAPAFAGMLFPGLFVPIFVTEISLAR